MRFATYGAALSRAGPGLLLSDILEREEGALAAAEVVAAAAPDVLLLTSFDYDARGAALGAFAELVEEQGLPLPHAFAGRPNAGMATGIDMDLDGRAGTPRDAQGYGEFAGDGGLAVLSRYPMRLLADFTPLLWADMPGATLPTWRNGLPMLPPEVVAVQRLSSTAHWVLEVAAPEGPVTLMVWAATPPVFDGPEDRNGLRARDELLLWDRYLDGALGEAPAAPFVLMGLSNLDPEAGEGDRAAMAAFLADPRLIDPAPVSATGERATAEWESGRRLRVSYVLPSADWQVAGAAVHWPAPGEPLAEAGGPHRLVWVDLTR
ncbi:endonuclease/exonuclease/phosphatase family protein [Pseudoroseicyclus sp. CXY001]|uniref:endonuclease/exonuclease/phosphatase family protein n=1 Tax=Pseudoroseicyclus sp. CXY001 TaxID=3242492 RepID=UPI00358DBCD3